MSIIMTEYEHKIIAEAADDMACIISDTLTDFYADYFIVGRTTSGGRFYSTMMSCEEAYALLDNYESVVEYFGGGTVTLYEVTMNGYDVVLTRVVH